MPVPAWLQAVSLVADGVANDHPVPPLSPLLKQRPLFLQVQMGRRPGAMRDPGLQGLDELGQDLLDDVAALCELAEGLCQKHRVQGLHPVSPQPRCTRWILRAPATPASDLPTATCANAR